MALSSHNHVGMSPIKAGSKIDTPHWAFLSICTAFETYIAINQLNGTSSLNRRNKLSKILNAIFNVKPCPNQPNHWLVKRITAATAIDLKATKAKNAEERRIKWTTYKNLDMWFENWISNLVKLGFATKLNMDNPNDSTIHISDEQMAQIMNFDETCCSLAELNILIRYHGAVPKGGKLEKTAKWKAICDKGKKPAVCLPWTEPEEAAL